MLAIVILLLILVGGIMYYEEDYPELALEGAAIGWRHFNRES